AVIPGVAPPVLERATGPPLGVGGLGGGERCTTLWGGGRAGGSGGRALERATGPRWALGPWVVVSAAPLCGVVAGLGCWGVWGSGSGKSDGAPLGVGAPSVRGCSTMGRAGRLSDHT